MTARSKRARPREVVNVVDMTYVMLPPRGHVEVRERKDGTYRVWYPDEGFVPCAPSCDLRHKHEYKQGHVESFYHPATFDDAVEWAYKLADGREVKIVPVNTGAVKKG